MPKVTETQLNDWSERYHLVRVRGKRALGAGWQETPATAARVADHLKSRASKGRAEHRLGIVPAHTKAPDGTPCPLVVVDVDLPEGSPDGWIDSIGVPHVVELFGNPLHRVDSDSGGAHLYYRGTGHERNPPWPCRHEDIPKGDMRARGDIRGLGGCIVLWRGSTTLAALDKVTDPTIEPIDVTRLLVKTKTKKDNRPDAARLAEAPAGSRNNALYRAAKDAAREGADKETTKATLQDACDHNKMIDEDGILSFNATFESGWNAGCAAAKIGQNLSEGELAEGFSKLFPEYRHHTIHGWMHFANGVWTPTPNVPDQVYAFIKDSKPDDLTEQKAWRRNFRAVTARGTEYLAQSAARITGTFDAQPDRCGVPGGQVLDLRTATLRRGHEEDRISRRLGTVPADIPTPAWDQLLAQIAPDKERRIYLQRFVGYVLTGDTHLHKFLFVQGPGGSGKTTFVNVLRALLGEEGEEGKKGYHREVPTDAFVGRYESHPEWLARLDGARLITIGELPTGAWKVNLLKNLTGGEPVVARYMRQNSFEYKPVCKVIIAGEHKPKIDRVDEGMKRRLVLVKVPRLAKKDRDSRLPERLMQELPGIAHWAMMGARAYYKAGRKLPKEPKAWAAAADDYFEEQDTIRAWFDEYVTVTEDGFTSWRDLRDSYSRFHGGRQSISTSALREWFEEQALPGRPGRPTSSSPRGWIGLSLKDMASLDFFDTA